LDLARLRLLRAAAGCLDNSRTSLRLEVSSDFYTHVL
jgi:hypothetical protein